MNDEMVSFSRFLESNELFSRLSKSNGFIDEFLTVTSFDSSNFENYWTLIIELSLRLF